MISEGGQVTDQTKPASAVEEVEAFALKNGALNIGTWYDLALDLARRLEKAQHELDMMKSAGVIECAIRNPSVAEYMRHWEGRAESAEAALKEAQGLLLEWLGHLHAERPTNVTSELKERIRRRLDSQTGKEHG